MQHKFEGDGSGTRLVETKAAIEGDGGLSAWAHRNWETCESQEMGRVMHASTPPLCECYPHTMTMRTEA